MDLLLRRAYCLAMVLAALLVRPLAGAETAPGKRVNCGTANQPLYRQGSGPSSAEIPPLGAVPYAQFTDLTAEGAEKPCTWPYNNQGDRELLRGLWTSHAPVFGEMDWDNTAPGSDYRRVILDFEGRRIVLKSIHPFIKPDPAERPAARSKREAFDAIVSKLEETRRMADRRVRGNSQPETTERPAPSPARQLPLRADVEALEKMTLEQLQKTCDEHENARVRHIAIRRILSEGEPARRLWPWLAVRLSSAPDISLDNAISKMGPPGEEERPALARLLEHQDTTVRRNASSALAAMGGAGARSQGELERAVRRSTGSERILHAQSLTLVAPGSPRTTAFLHELLRNSPSQGRDELVKLLLKLNAHDEEVLKLFKSTAGSERMQLAALLLRFDAANAAVREFFQSASGADRTAVARLLFGSGRRDEEVLEALLEGVRRADPEALHYFLASPEAPRAVPILLDHLKNGAGPELGTIYALGGLGPAAADAVPALVERLSSDRAAVRSAAAYALGRMGPAASVAASRLDGLRRDSAPSVRRHAQAALAAIGWKKPWWRLW